MLQYPESQVANSKKKWTHDILSLSDSCFVEVKCIEDITVASSVEEQYAFDLQVLSGCLDACAELGLSWLQGRLSREENLDLFEGNDGEVKVDTLNSSMISRFQIQKDQPRGKNVSIGEYMDLQDTDDFIIWGFHGEWLPDTFQWLSGPLQSTEFPAAIAERRTLSPLPA